jgi:ketosteroid isomerase-like protein
MNNGLLSLAKILTLAPVMFLPASLSSAAAVDPAAAEIAVRKADADWLAAASTASVGAWTSFYSSDAIVLLPNDQLATGKSAVRQSVTRFLARPHFQVTSHPVDVKVDPSGNAASLIGMYELRFDDPRGPAAARGRRLEIWRRQADGWKCVVDTWNLDPPAGPSARPSPTAYSPAAPSPAPPSPAAPTTGLSAASEPSAPGAPPEAGPPAPARGASTKYGDAPTNYEEAIRKYFLEHLKHPETVRYREITRPEQGYTTELAGGLLMREKREYGWTVKASIDAQDSHDRYVGPKTYTFLFRGERIVDARLPLPGDEMN